MYPNEEIQFTGKPAATVVNSASGKIERIYKNIENEPLINHIKALEEKLEILTGVQSVELDIEEIENPEMKDLQTLSPEQAVAKKEEILNKLLADFGELLKTQYGSLGYLVMSESEQILKLYGVDTDDDYFFDFEGSTMRISSSKLEKMVAAGGGKRWIGEDALHAKNPAETQDNRKIADEAINRIMQAIKNMLAELQK